MANSKKLLAFLAPALVLCATSAPAASAAVEVGSNCAANNVVADYTVLQLSQAPGSPLPLAAPAAGVVTKWKVNSATPAPPGLTLSERLRVFRATGNPNAFQTVAESSPSAIQSGQNTFETRISVQAGDRFGASAVGSSAASMICSTENTTDALGIVGGDVPPGGSATYTPVQKLQLALSVTIEPDADRDGFGDETQDRCPQSAAHQICPALKLKAVSTPPGKSAIRVLVASDSQATITVSASAKVPKGKKGKGTTLTRLLPVAQLVAPGEIIIYTINFNKALKDALKALPRKKSVKLEIVAEGKSLSGSATTERLAVKLKGQAKPAR